ncbi:hypothetical protein AWW66_28455 [Micromonospora rosaria]|uniref:Uncharacterized protein n=1 Tax=Micromonospora rosaria TaxID=47874 RepID=A0A136PJR3_9ACTN|nr:hypothetical protein AWW66_28455 [Micromonospora rosaria]
MPLAPAHRRNWRRWGRYCGCGLRWRNCPDRHLAVPVEPVRVLLRGGRSDRPAAPSGGRAGRWSVVRRLLTRGWAGRSGAGRRR